MIDTGLLNEEQREAVLAEDKYIRVVAGAGSGKTRVLTMRIAHLIQDLGVFPSRILAITFTNKAANEMKERIKKMMPEETGQAWISTIHSLCVRILREDILVMNWPRNFTVLDEEDQKSILREAYKELKVDAQTFSLGSLISYISNNKTAEISVERAFILAGEFGGEKTKAKIYEYYVNRQNSLYALDFDDLILWTVKMFRRYSEVLAKWQKRFRHIHVDEFQDIDKLQYELIRQLAGTENSLYVVGDPDQTIYTWRGADVNIILNFTKDFPGTRTIMLNRNYRSTAAILNGANSVIKNNRHRLEKDLYTDKESTEKIVHYASAGDEYEAAWIAGKIRELHAKGLDYHDIAVLYRSNYLSRTLEKAFLDERIPYVIYGGVRFYERQEVKDALCYLRMVTSADDLAFRRVINKPRRGIGNKTMETIENRARELHLSMYEVVKNEELFSGRTQKTVNDFVAMVERWRREAESGETELFRLFEKIIEESGLRSSYESNKELDRVENLKELIDDAREFSEDYPDSTLEEYLQLVSLYGDRDETMSSDFVQLMTVHAAKGLEFDTVFVSDMNDGIFPNERAMNDGPRGVEEERRLAYVAFTRARNRLFITEAGGFSFILQKARTQSRFIEEIDEKYIEHQGAVPKNQPELSFAREFVNTAPFTERLRSSAAAVQYKKGEQVIHSKFGEGVVLSCQNGIANIAFAYPWGTKNIAAGHPSLKKKSEIVN
ncbi:MAG: UvrD-helicase domain-containing protein [Solobacterium sp.]|nr:UvrD-helicase domain-containing protein [Solobacterium sp.]